MGSNGSRQQAAADYYTLLGLSDLRETATPEQIRKAYLTSALKFHPDKHTSLILTEPTEAARKAKKEEIETKFKRILAAYEVLSDPNQRKNYDSRRSYSSNSRTSTRNNEDYDDYDDDDQQPQQQAQQHDDTDDDFPTECAPGFFFKVFGPVFERYSRWSATKPVPGLGDEGTPMEEVDKFYKFWLKFKSSRDFTDRYHWKRDRDKAKKQENIKIRRLVNSVLSRDPRILKRKEDEEAMKLRRKMEKQMRMEAEATAKARAAARAAEEESRRKEEEEKRTAEAAKVKEREKKLLQKERSRFQKLSLGFHGTIEKDDVERLCMWFDFEKLRNVCEIIEEGKDDEALMERLAKIVNKIKQEEEDQKKKSSTQHVDGSVKKEERIWGKEEIELLKKGREKFPKGTPRRWEAVSDYIGTGRSVEEVVKAMKRVVDKKPDDSKAFDSFLEKRKPSKSIDSPLTTRIEVEGVSMSSASISTSPPQNDKKSESGSTSSSSEKDDVWSVEEEKAMIQAMKILPKELTGGARWKRVAAAVQGKTANQCKQRFAMLKENLRSKKSSA